jgi:Putative peptidoglycan binding domain
MGSRLSSWAAGRTRRLVGLVLTLVLLLLPGSAAAAACSGDTLADGTTWNDNYWGGYNTAGTITCDLNGRYTLGIQRINWEEGYRQSSPDGFYGSNTHQDVRSFQAFYGLTVDGLVGPSTWTKVPAAD